MTEAFRIRVRGLEQRKVIFPFEAALAAPDCKTRLCGSTALLD
jgi:hypothetical protein